MASLDKAFRRHSRAQIASVPGNQTNDTTPPTRHLPQPRPAQTVESVARPEPAFPRETVVRRSRVLNAKSTPSWIAATPALSVEKTIVPAIDQRVIAPALVAVRGNTRAKPTVSKAQWVEFIRLGVLTQGGKTHLICSTRTEKTLVMFRDVGSGYDAATVPALNLRHPSIVTAKWFVTSDTTVHVGLEYIRYTLEELLHVHIAMNETHIRSIATSIFEALKYLHANAFQHNNVDIRSIRVCGRTGRAMLNDCEGCKSQDRATNTDLEGLGLALLDCMEGSPRGSTAAQVREQRASNRVFGLTEPEKWSGHKQLIDFVDDLFSIQRDVGSKFGKPRKYVTQGYDAEDSLITLTELASLECFTLWHAA